MQIDGRKGFVTAARPVVRVELLDGARDSDDVVILCFAKERWFADCGDW